MLLAALLLLAAASTRPFAEERTLLDRRLETLRRILPDGPTPQADAAIVRGIASQIGLQGIDALARPPADTNAAVAHVVIDVTGAARFADVDRFFRQLALHDRLVDVESLSLRATGEGLVKLTGVVRFPYRPTKAPLPPPPLGVRAPTSGVSRPQAEAFLRDQALALAKSDAIASLRRARRNPRLFLSEIAAIARDRPVVFSEAILGEDFQLRGLTIGESPSRALESRLERGFLRLTELVMVRQGACRRFEAKGRSPVAGPDAELPLPSEDPFGTDESACRVDRDTSRGAVLQAPPPPPRAPRGPLTLRLRDVDLSDLFLVLHSLTGQSFLVDADITGRVGVDLQGVGVDDVLSALRKIGLRITQSPGMLRVSLASGASPRPPLVGPPVPLESDDAQASATPRRMGAELKREGVREILAVMTDVDPAMAALGPQGSYGRLSLYVDDAPVADVRAAILEASFLVERVEEGRRVLRRANALDDPVFPVASTPADRRLVLRAQDLDSSEIDLAGVATYEGRAAFAFAYAPNGRLYAYKRGDRFADGNVKSIDATDVTLETDEGTVRIALPPLSR